MSDDAQAVLNIFSGCCTKFQLQRVEHLGFSGSSLWKVVASDSTFLPNPLCLKRWPADHPPPARLSWIHQVLQRARQQGLAFVPEPQPTRTGSTICDWGGSTWELMTWQPGEVDHSSPPAPARIAAAFRALARFHATTTEPQLSITPHTFQPAPAFADRVIRWHELVTGKIVHIRQAVQRHRIPVIDDLAQKWIALLPALPQRIGDQLVAASRLSFVLQPAIRDLWRDHVLFVGNEVTGLIDLGAMRADTPLTDIARLLGSLVKDDASLRVAALNAYAEIRALEQRDRDLIDLLDYSGTFIAGWNWLEWLYVDQRHFPSLTAVRGRLVDLLSRQLDGRADMGTR